MKKEQIMEELTMTKIDLNEVHERINRLRDSVTDDIPKNMEYILNEIVGYVGVAQDEVEKAESV
jgi:hypothetical protein